MPNLFASDIDGVLLRKAYGPVHDAVHESETMKQLRSAIQFGMTIATNMSVDKLYDYINKIPVHEKAVELVEYVKDQDYYTLGITDNPLYSIASINQLVRNKTGLDEVATTHRTFPENDKITSYLEPVDSKYRLIKNTKDRIGAEGITVLLGGKNCMLGVKKMRKDFRVISIGCKTEDAEHNFNSVEELYDIRVIF